MKGKYKALQSSKGERKERRRVAERLKRMRELEETDALTATDGSLTPQDSIPLRGTEEPEVSVEPEIPREPDGLRKTGGTKEPKKKKAHFKFQSSKFATNHKSITKRKSPTKVGNILAKMKRVDKLSWFFITCTLIITVGVLGLFINSMRDTEEAYGIPYFNETLNFSVLVPKGWAIAEGDPDHIKEQVKRVTGGIRFDMMQYSLKEELAPLSMALQTTSKDKKIGFKKMMSLSFLGSDSRYSYLEDKTYLKEEFERFLKALKHTDIKMTSSYDYRDEYLNGVLVKATANLQGQKLYYYQYLEPAGGNILKVVYASDKKSDDHMEDIQKTLSSLKYHEGGGVYDPALKDFMLPEEQTQEVGGHYHEDGSFHADDETGDEHTDIEVKVEKPSSSIEIKDKNGNPVEQQEE